MSDVMKANEKENEELKVTLEATEHKLGCPLTAKNLLIIGTHGRFLY